MNENENNKSTAENKDERNVPYFIHEGIIARMDRTIKRLWLLNIIQTIVILIVIGVFIWYLNQYDYESYNITSSDSGYASYVGNDGDIYNGIRESEEKSKQVGSERQSNS